MASAPKNQGFPVNRIGLGAGPLSQWLHAGLTQAAFETVLLETRHVKAALSAMTVKTDRKDASANDLVGKSDVEVREAIGDKFPKHIYHSIVCIGALIAHGEPDHWAVDAVGAPVLRQ